MDWRELREERLDRVNEFLAVMGSHGRKFFCHEGVVSWLEQDERGRIWFVDSWQGTRVYTHREGRWRGFHHGGTLKGLVKALKRYVMEGTMLSPRALWWPEWYCAGDLWGYGEAMHPVREAALRLGLVVSGE